jgi:hypothetical protein
MRIAGSGGAEKETGGKQSLWQLAVARASVVTGKGGSHATLGFSFVFFFLGSQRNWLAR